MWRWYVVQTKPRKESVAVENLERQGYKVYCPQIMQAKHRQQRWKKVTAPLFPRYLFVQLDIGVDDFAPIRSTIGVLGLVRFGNNPAVMPQHLIGAIQQQEQRIFTQAKIQPNWKPGDRVEILTGPFAGLNGIFEKADNEERVIILLEMLGRNNRIVVNTDSVITT